MGKAFLKDNNGVLLKLSEVLFTPNLTQSLISLNRLFTQNSAVSKDRNTFVVKLDNTLSLSGSIHNNLWELSPTFEMNLFSLCFLSSVSPNWHAQLGNPSSVYLKKMIIPSAKTSNNCKTCKMCKSTKLPFKRKFASVCENLEAIHLDLVGPFQTQSVSGC